MTIGDCHIDGRFGNSQSPINFAIVNRQCGNAWDIHPVLSRGQGPRFFSHFA
jgi:hypothetical protein